MAKRKSYNLDFTASVKGNLSPKRKKIEQFKSKYNVESIVNKRFEQHAKDIENAKNKAWINRLGIKKTSAQHTQDLYQDMTKMLYPQHFRSKLLSPETPNEIVNKLTASLYELYKEQLPNIRYVALHQGQLEKMYGDYKFAKAWESDVFKSLAHEYTTKQLSDDELLNYVTGLDKYKQAKLYNLLYSYKAMPTGHYKGIQELGGKLAANRQAILAGTIYENAPKDEQDKYVSAYYKVFREWAKSLDKALYDSEDAFAVFQSINFTDIDSLNMNDILAGELFDRLSSRAQDRLEEEELLENQFKKTSKFRVHSMGRTSNSMKDKISFEDALFDESIDVEDRLMIAEQLGIKAKIIDGELYVSKSDNSIGGLRL